MREQFVNQVLSIRRSMAFKDHLLACFLVVIAATAHVAADLIEGCGGFVEASSALIKLRKQTDTKLDYPHITVSAVVDHTGCNANEDINFRFTGFTVSGRVVGAVGGASCPNKNGGPSNVNVELLSPTGGLVLAVLTSLTGSYSFTNIIPGKYKIRASRPDLNVEVRGSVEVELGFGNALVDDIFVVPGYEIRGSVVAQGNPILGVHIYLYSNDVSRLDCTQGTGNVPGQRKALCHAISDAEGMFKSIPCGVYELIPYYKGENTVFDVSPPSMSVSVEHDHATVAAPKFQVGSEDFKGLDFLVFEQPELTILSGRVLGKRIDELQSHLHVEIKSANDPSKMNLSSRYLFQISSR